MAAAQNGVRPAALGAATLLLWPAAWWNSRRWFEGGRSVWSRIAAFVLLAATIFAQYGIYAAYRHVPLPDRLAALADAIAVEAARMPQPPDVLPMGMWFRDVEERAPVKGGIDADNWREAAKRFLEFLQAHPADAGDLEKRLTQLKREPHVLSSLVHVSYAARNVLWHYAAALWLEGRYGQAISVVDTALSVSEASVRSGTMSIKEAARERIRRLDLVVAMVWGVDQVPDEALDELERTLLAHRWGVDLVRAGLRAIVVEGVRLRTYVAPLGFLPCERRRLAALATTALDYVSDYVENVWTAPWSTASGPVGLPIRSRTVPRPDLLRSTVPATTAASLTQAEALEMLDLMQGLQEAVVGSWLAERALRVATAAVAVRRYEGLQGELPETIVDLPLPDRFRPEDVLWDVRLAPRGLSLREPPTGRTTLVFDVVLGAGLRRSGQVDVADPLAWAAGWPFEPTQPVLLYDADGNPYFADRLAGRRRAYAVAVPLKRTPEADRRSSGTE